MNSKVSKEKRLSPYFPYVVAKKSKAFLLNFAEFSLTFVLTFILFMAAGYPIFFSTSYAVNANNGISSKQSSLNEIVLSTRLATKTNQEVTTLDDPEIMVKSYVESLAKTSFYINNKQYKQNSKDGLGNIVNVDIKKEETLINIDNDPLYYYFYVFKPSKESLDSYVYEDIDYSSNKDSYLYEKAYGYTIDRFKEVDSSISIYRQISLDEASILNDYFLYGHAADKVTYDYYGNAFLRARSVFVSEVESKYTPYIEIQNSFMEDYHVIVSGLVAALCLCYFVSFLILQVIVPLISKNKRGISAYMLKAGYCKDDGSEMDLTSILLRALYDLFSYFAPSFLILYFIGYGEFAFMELFGFVSLFYICLMSFIFTLSSLVFMMVSKSNRGLGEKLASIEIKDLNMMEPSDPLSDKEIEDGKK